MELDWNQSKRDIYRSLISSVIFGIAAGLSFLMWRLDLTLIYIDLQGHSWLYLVLSLGVLLFLQESYYYWMHRAIHLPPLYKRIHKWHHESVETNVFSSFSFHPIESFLQAIFFPIIILLIPFHISVIIIYLLILTVSATVNHAGIEIFPNWFLRTFPFSQVIGSSHHDIHHKQFNSNYGLYFRFWDQWMNTESRRYQKSMDQ